MKHLIWIDSTNYSNTFINSFNSELIYILQHQLYLQSHILISNKFQSTKKQEILQENLKLVTTSPLDPNLLALGSIDNLN